MPSDIVGVDFAFVTLGSSSGRGISVGGSGLGEAGTKGGLCCDGINGPSRALAWLLASRSNAESQTQTNIKKRIVVFMATKYHKTRKNASLAGNTRALSRKEQTTKRL